MCKVINITVLKLEGTTGACSAKNISTKFLFDSLPARFVFKIILKFNFKLKPYYKDLRLYSYLYKISETIEENLL